MEASLWGLLLNISLGGIYILWENHVHQQQFSVIKSSIRSHVHLSFLGVPCSFHLITKDRQCCLGKNPIAYFSVMFKCANKRLHFDLGVEDAAVLKDLHVVQALL